MYRSRSFLSVLITAVGVLACGASSFAAPVSGALNIIGSVTLGNGTIDFSPSATGSGTATIGGGSGGNFAPFVGSPLTILDMSSAGDPVGTPLSISNFMTIPASPLTTFTLTFVNPGIDSTVVPGAPAAGQTYTPVGTQFNFTNLSSTSSELSFTMQLLGVNTSTLETTNYTGVFSMQFADLNLQNVNATLGSGGSVTTTFSASFAPTPVPEPASMGLIVLLAGAAVRRRARVG